MRRRALESLARSRSQNEAKKVIVPLNEESSSSSSGWGSLESLALPTSSLGIKVDRLRLRISGWFTKYESKLGVSKWGAISSRWRHRSRINSWIVLNSQKINSGCMKRSILSSGTSIDPWRWWLPNFKHLCLSPLLRTYNCRILLNHLVSNM